VYIHYRKVNKLYNLVDGRERRCKIIQ